MSDVAQGALYLESRSEVSIQLDTTACLLSIGSTTTSKSMQGLLVFVAKDLGLSSSFGIKGGKYVAVCT
jgi:hypothetical protein